MKRMLAVLLLVVAPLAVFADFQVGVTALYAGTPFGLSTSAGTDSPVPFGVEARWKFLYVFQLGLDGLILTGPSPALTLLTDAGIVVDLPPFTVGGGIGPDFTIALGGEGNPATTLINFKAFGEFNFDIFAVGLVIFEPVSALGELRHNWPWVGISGLVTLF